MSEVYRSIGRRKNAVARLSMKEGTGVTTINGRQMEDYFPSINSQNTLIQPLQIANLVNKMDITVNAHGGGVTGQVGAVRLALSRALIKFNPALRAELKPKDLLRRDPRMKERKKPGQPGARKRFQFSKR